MEDRNRTVLAIALLLLVAIVPSFFISRGTSPALPEPTDPAEIAAPTATENRQPASPVPDRPLGAASVGAAPGDPADPVLAGEEDVHVRSGIYDYTFSTRGARLTGATLFAYRSLAPGEEGGDARIIPDDSEFLTYSFVIGRDTIPFGDWQFEPSSYLVEVSGGGGELSWVGRRGSARVELTQRFHPENYLFDVSGSISGLPGESGLLLVGLGPGLRLPEADSTDNYREYAVVTKADRTEKLNFRSLDPGERAQLDGPFEWVTMKSKYFLAAILQLDPERPALGGGMATGGIKDGRSATRAHVQVSLPATGGRFAHSVYVGPQEYRRLADIGHGLPDVNPYGWIFRPIIGPFSILIVRILRWGNETWHIGYGWMLIMFGVGIRALLWPLNQKAMRSQMAMQALQPEIEALRTRFKDDPQRLNQETMKLWKEHKVSPLGGCLPMLLPMPFLFAFFFVFRNTIELRGVPFLWLPDLSRGDPLYIVPILMGASMFLVSKLGQRGLPPNPQTKMMLYAMPIIFTVMFMNFASGLNLYYASQNIASIPQQWMISRERMRQKAGKK